MKAKIHTSATKCHKHESCNVPGLIISFQAQQYSHGIYYMILIIQNIMTTLIRMKYRALLLVHPIQFICLQFLLRKAHYSFSLNSVPKYIYMYMNKYFLNKLKSILQNFVYS